MLLKVGQVAVVTGAASGIGRALAVAFADRGLSVVAADLEAGGVEQVASELRERGGTAAAFDVDVRNGDRVQELAEFTLEQFGRVDVVCNNAGVMGPLKRTWENSSEDWRWLVEVNLLGVANGIRAFVPHFIRQRTGYVVNTASLAGLRPTPGGRNAPYTAAKFGVVGLSETLRFELDAVAPDVGVTVLCPGGVATAIRDSESHRPAELRQRTPDGIDVPARRPQTEPILSAEEVARQTLKAIEENRLHLLPNPGCAQFVQDRVTQLMNDLN